MEKLEHKQNNFVFLSIKFLIVILSLTGIICYETHMYNYLPVQMILDIFLIVLVFKGCDFKINKINVIILFVIAIQLLLTLFIFKYRDQGYFFSDYILIYKTYFYIFLLALPQRYCFSCENLKSLLTIFVSFLLVKYVCAKYIWGLSRPGLFIENNFELLAVVLFYFSLVYFRVKLCVWVHISIFILIFISGSRSAMACLVCSMFFLFNKNSYKIKLIKYLLLISLLFLMLYIFVARMQADQISSIQAIDRVKFLFVFMHEFDGFSIGELFWGKDIITPLSDWSCNVLSYYADFYEAAEKGNCFSVVLHSFILRTIFDHGIIGLFIIILIYTYFLKKAKFDWKFTFAIISIAILNGLSVSSFNSIFFNLPLYLILLSSNSLSNNLEISKNNTQ